MEEEKKHWKDKTTWVEDIKIEKAFERLDELNKENDFKITLRQSPFGSCYVVGKSKSGDPNETGIYFYDATKKIK